MAVRKHSARGDTIGDSWVTDRVPAGERAEDAELVFEVVEASQTGSFHAFWQGSIADVVGAPTWFDGGGASTKGRFTVRTRIDPTRGDLSFGVARRHAGAPAAGRVVLRALRLTEAAPPTRASCRSALGRVTGLVLASCTIPEPTGGPLRHVGELVGPDPAPRNAPLAKEQARALLHRIEADEGGVELVAVRALIRRHRALLTHLNREVKEGASEGAIAVARYVAGVMLRTAELAGGRLALVTAADLAAAEKYLDECLEARVPHPLGLERTVKLLPFDEEFRLRARAFRRPQEHVLDRVLEHLFEVEPGTPWQIEPSERAWVYLQAWKAMFAIDRVWRGPRPPGATHPEESAP